MKISKYLLIFFISLQFLNAQNKVAISNSGFDKIDSGKPAGWKAVSGEIVFSADNSALLIDNKDYKKSTVQSESFKMKLGKLYKLSGKIKTENAYTERDAQYPTPVPACLSMESFPFTNSSPAVGSTKDWQNIEVVFIATEKEDRICLNLGYNGGAIGKAWFDDIKLEEIEDITQYIDPSTVKWYGKAFAFEDKGWIFVHIEGEPYQRGVQYGYLVADEIKDFINKHAIKKNTANPQSGWNDIRFAADALMLRKYDEEYLTEMKGIADGANKAGVTLFNRKLDLIDIVAMNSLIDIDYAADALHTTPNALTGKSFLAQEDELTIQDKLHKCSAFLANKSATKSSRIVYGQIFMWNGYTGPLWNIIVDVVPSKGNRLVYQTFPGGIHSGADFYLNSKGIMLGETTVMQTPFNQDGTPQSNRIRKAAQYANSIDDVVKIMTEKNNGMYTNDWLIADTKTDEIAILVLGTEKYKLWRSSANDFYGGQKDWYFSNNNNKSLEVRKEYIVNEQNAPYDLAFRPMNRDIAFTEFYEKNYGKIDAKAGVDLWNSSPINRPHACDGKITTSEMTENLMFLANYGKVTLREMFVNENGRIQDLPGAVPKFSLGYTVIAPILFTEKLQALNKIAAAKPEESKKINLDGVKDLLSYNKEELWQNTVYPASDKENWFISASAAYWNLLNSTPASLEKAKDFVDAELSELNARLNYVLNTEGNLVPVKAQTSYKGYKDYQIPRIKGTFALHQARLFMGNELFAKAMKEIHNTFNKKNVTNNDILNIFEKHKKGSNDIIKQWIETDVVADLEVSLNKNELTIKQKNNPVHFFTTINDNNALKVIEVKEKEITIKLDKEANDLKVNELNDIPQLKEEYYTFSNFTDDFSKLLIVYGTTRQIEANHTIALKFQKMAADRFTETLVPIKKDCEVNAEELKNNDLVVLGSSSENALSKTILEKLGITVSKNSFVLNGKTYSAADDGAVVVYPNPYNNKRSVYIFLANSTMQLYQMTKTLNRIPSWAIFKKDQITEKGYNF